MTPAKTHDPRDATQRPDSYSRVPADRTVLALLQVGTRRCRLAAAVVAVVVALASQTANQALAQARQTVLYLDAPVVSGERASRAGEIADAYSAPDSPVSREILAWLEVPLRPVDVAATPEDAEVAFDSVTAQDTEGTGAITAEAALEAGEVMIAQLDASPSAEDGDAEQAAADAVRPRLGGGTQASSEVAEEKSAGEFVADPQWRPEGGSSPHETEVEEYASSPDTAAPDTEPSRGSALVVPPPSSDGEEAEQLPPTELAAAASDPGLMLEPDDETEDEPYDPAGPITDTGQSALQQPAFGTTAAAHDAGAETIPDGGIAASEPPPGEGEFAEAEPPAAAPTAEPAPTPAPLGADPGLASGRGEEFALVPVSSADAAEGITEPAPAPPDEDEESEKIAYAEPPTEEAPEQPSSENGIPAALHAERGGEPGDQQSQMAPDQQQAELVVVNVVVAGETPPSESLAADPAEQSVEGETPVDQGDEVVPSLEESAPPQEMPLPPVGDGQNDPNLAGGAGQGGVPGAHQQPEEPSADTISPAQRTEPRTRYEDAIPKEPSNEQQMPSPGPSAEDEPAPTGETGMLNDGSQDAAPHALEDPNQVPEHTDPSSPPDHNSRDLGDRGHQDDAPANREERRTETTLENAGVGAATPRYGEEPVGPPVAFEGGIPAAPSRDGRRVPGRPVTARSAQEALVQQGRAEPTPCQTTEPRLTEHTHRDHTAERQAERRTVEAQTQEPEPLYQELEPQTADARTHAQPAPAGPQRVELLHQETVYQESFYQEPVQRVASQPLAPASAVPAPQVAPEVQEPVYQEPAPTAAAAPTQQVEQGAGMQAARQNESIDTPAVGQ